jgi:hypothetical protein
MNPAAPKILNDIVDTLKSKKIAISEKVEGEGRGGSLNDEGTIKRYLQSLDKFKPHVSDVPPRGFGDMLVLDYDGTTYHVVNIKTSVGSSDNSTSKIGFLYAFTDISYDEMPKSINWKKFDQLIKSRRADIAGRDYWFLTVDKNDSSNVLVRGAKQIVNWCENANPANLLQINWSKEKLCDPAERTYDEAYEVIIGGILRCYKKAFNNLPEEWAKEILK